MLNYNLNIPEEIQLYLTKTYFSTTQAALKFHVKNFPLFRTNLFSEYVV